jgi:outer membrane receptor protein involved in Fe transport
VAFAIGAEHRRQSIKTISDAGSAALDWRQGNASPFAGHYSVDEGYFEFGIPLLKDSPIGKALDLDLAGRYTEYSTSGAARTWKAGLNYSVTDDVRLRATRSHDIRAPNLQELYQTGVLRAGFTVTNPINNVTVPVNNLTSGNPALTPEIGDTYTGGVIYSPSWLPGFNASADYWSIKLTNQILTVPAQTVVNNCLRFNITSFCPAITYDPNTGNIQTVASTQFNVAALKTDGWDFEVGYKFKGEDLNSHLAGDFQANFIGTYLHDYITDQFGIVLNTAGGVSTGRPRFRSNVNLIWQNEPWRVSVNGNWEGGGPYNAIYNSTKYTYAQGARTINDNNVDGRFYTNVAVNRKVTDAWEVYVNVRNLFDIDPPIIPDTVNFQHAVGNDALYDRIGGQWSVGAKLAF